MIMAAWWGFVGGFALIVGALIASVVKVPHGVLGLVMGFGAGVLISAVAFELTLEAFEKGGGHSAVIGLLAGAAVFFIGDWLIDNAGGHRRKSPHRQTPVAAGGAMALVLGALLDGLPESAAIGASLLEGGGVSAAIIAAVFLSNVPESLSATSGLRSAGRSYRYIFTLWGLVTLAATIAAAVGYLVLGQFGPAVTAFVQCFAAGAIITMLGDTMVPEASEHAGRFTGLSIVIGFICAFLLSHA